MTTIGAFVALIVLIAGTAISMAFAGLLDLTYTSRATARDPSLDQMREVQEDELREIEAELLQAHMDRLGAVYNDTQLRQAGIEEQYSQWAQEPVWQFPLLQLSLPTTHGAVMAAFRRAAKSMHPDHGGDPIKFRGLIAERDEALATCV